jgi:hypothetical protein
MVECTQLELLQQLWWKIVNPNLVVAEGGGLWNGTGTMTTMELLMEIQPGAVLTMVVVVFTKIIQNFVKICQTLQIILQNGTL